jgi:uridine phosphorylase
MEQRAWYLGAAASEVADRALLVGDPGRIDRIAERLDGPVQRNERRGLKTVTGSFGGHRITAAAFGMGAPIAAIVVHELRALGTSWFLRLGTAMTLGPACLGEFLLPEAAIRGEQTSGTYVPEGFPAAGDHDLGTALRHELDRAGLPWRAGLFASYDGFYTQMLALTDDDRHHLRPRIDQLSRLGVIGMDMETSAVLAVARALGGRAACLCVGTVAWGGPEVMDDDQREQAENRLIEIGLRTLCRLDRHPNPANDSQGGNQ